MMSNSSESSATTEPENLEIWQLFYLVQMLICGFVFSLMYQIEDVTFLPILLVVMALIFGNLYLWTAPVLIGLVTAFSVRSDLLQFRTGDWLSSFLCMLSFTGMLMGMSRFRTLLLLERRGSQEKISALRRVIRMIRLLFGGSEHDDEFRHANERDFGKALLSSVRAMALVAGCAIAAALLLGFVPNQFDRYFTLREFAINPYKYRLATNGLLLFILFMPAWLLINESCWRQCTPQQASLYVRTSWLKWAHRDLRMIMKKRVRLKRKWARRRPDPEPQDISVETEEKE
ncbi:MAG TPA: hypothetical protein DCG12_19980 [Planctomycetaceae bacterium]|nr:hypothetical protein [Planctomycetaceae bacterium]